MQVFCQGSLIKSSDVAALQDLLSHSCLTVLREGEREREREREREGERQREREGERER